MHCTCQHNGEHSCQVRALRPVTAQGSSSEEYAPRLWQGMLGDYYRRRWEMWFDYIERRIGANKVRKATS